MPGTWDYVQQNLAGRQLDPSSARDNVSAGVLYLKRLLADSGGSESTAIAAYYQGLGSVRSRGMFDDTRQYVANVQALRARFGG
jgi:soluble lytic murein transglycosylase-like protein